jgi:uncharacterized protein
VNVFGDSSALVKLYANEPGSDVVREIARFAAAHTTRVEVPAALWKLNRMRLLTPRLTAALVGDFEADWFGDETGARRFGVVRMTSLVLEDAAHLTGVHGLRENDAIQLASARAVRSADPSVSTFAVFDGALRDAAATEGFVLLP